MLGTDLDFQFLVLAFCSDLMMPEKASGPGGLSTLAKWDSTHGAAQALPSWGPDEWLTMQSDDGFEHWEALKLFYSPTVQSRFNFVFSINC